MSLQPTVFTADNQPEMDPVTRAQILLAEATEAVERATRKRDKTQAEVDSGKDMLKRAKQALADAQAEQKLRQQELAAAREGQAS